MPRRISRPHLRRTRCLPPTPKGLRESDRENSHQGDSGKDRGVRAGPLDTGALAAPEDAEARQQHADDELQRVLRPALERPAPDEPDRDDDDNGSCSGSDRETELALRAPEADDDERNLEAFEQDALEGDGERITIRPAGRGSGP